MVPDAKWVPKETLRNCCPRVLHPGNQSHFLLWGEALMVQEWQPPMPGELAWWLGSGGQARHTPHRGRLYWASPLQRSIAPKQMWCFCLKGKCWRNYWKHNDVQFCLQDNGDRALKELFDSKKKKIRRKLSICLCEMRNQETMQYGSPGVRPCQRKEQNKCHKNKVCSPLPHMPILSWYSQHGIWKSELTNLNCVRRDSLNE